MCIRDRNKPDTSVQFIDATSDAFFRKSTNTNLMEDRHIAEIIRLFDAKANVQHVTETVAQQRIIDNDYNLSVSAYVEPKDTRQVTDIAVLNANLKTTVAKINQLRAEIDAIVAGIEA